MSAKKGNVSVIAALLAVDIALLLFFSGHDPSANLSPASAARLAVLAATPPVIYLASSLFSAQMKACFVFWRITNPLPSHRAFTELVHDDPRIDVTALRAKIVEFPRDARDQGVAWYRLYTGLAAREEVLDANKRYLLFRDAATVSLVLAFLAPALIFFSAGSWTAALCIFAAQFILCAIAARVAGNRLVATVLALASHSP
jgi:hypothetical protein